MTHVSWIGRKYKTYKYVLYRDCLLTLLLGHNSVDQILYSGDRAYWYNSNK